MNIYNISKGQLITLWIFGVMGWFVAMNESGLGSSPYDFFLILIPLVLVFYTIGWKNNKKEK